MFFLCIFQRLLLWSGEKWYSPYDVFYQQQNLTCLCSCTQLNFFFWETDKLEFACPTFKKNTGLTAAIWNPILYFATGKRWRLFLSLVWHFWATNTGRHLSGPLCNILSTCTVEIPQTFCLFSFSTIVTVLQNKVSFECCHETRKPLALLLL